MHRLIEIVFSSARSSYNHSGLLVIQQHPVLIYNIIKTIDSAARLQYSLNISRSHMET